MHPQEFIDRWQVTRSELADLLGKSRSVVDHWFSAGKSKISPPSDVLSRLDELHTQFCKWELEDQNIPHVRLLYEVLRDRRSDN